MLTISFVNIWLLLLIVGHSSAVSYNLPKFSPCASWNPNATTFANSSLVGSFPWDVFVDLNNAVYAPATSLSQVVVWSHGNNTPTRTISAGLNTPCGIFVTSNGDIYVDNVQNNGRVDKWTSNATSGVSVMNVTGRCISLFVDINDTLYCANDFQNAVFKTSLNSGSTAVTMAAGNGTPGSGAYMLHGPSGIFVDFNLNLYVADWANNRIQFFQTGQLNGSTIAGNGAPGTITLNGPTDVALDSDGYLFITDASNNRIVANGPTGYRCIVGCTNTNGTASNQLNSPHSVVFDSYGNLFVVDSVNNRIQKFFLARNSCDQTTTDDMITTAIATTTHIQARLSTTAQALTTGITSKIPIGNQTCFVPLLILTPVGSSFSSPMHSRRNEDFSMSSSIQLRCNNSISITTKWTIKSCTSNCSQQIQVDPSVSTTFSELFLPSRTLSFGLYELTLTVAMIISPEFRSSISAYVSIILSGIQTNLIQLGASMIARGYAQNLTLDPGSFSVDLDGNVFNTSDWKYEYYCRIFGYSNFPNISGNLLTIDDPRIDPFNPSCLSNQSKIAYSSSKSSLTIFSRSLLSNRTYQFLVQMENRRNSSIESSGYLLVQIGDADCQIILVACVISSMCASNLQYQRVNPTTQVALYSFCLGTCTSITNITWNIYQGFNNGSSSVIYWVPFNQTNLYDNIWFFGRNTNNFTSTNQLFLTNPQVQYWRFEVIYLLTSGRSSGSIDFLLNQPPVNGSCTISPLNGTTSTLFNILCSNWIDSDRVKDYSFDIWTTDPSKLLIIGFTSSSNYDLLLPAGNDNTSSVHLIARISDGLGCIAEYNMSSVRVIPDTAMINNLVDSLQVSTSAAANNPIVQLLVGGNSNTVGQVISSISQIMNQGNTQSLDKAVSSGVPAASISISSLDSTSTPSMNVSLNETALEEFNQQINTQANLRDYLMSFATNLAIATANSIKLQASSLAQLTQSTNQLTRNSALLASKKCYQLAVALYAMRFRISYEDVSTAATQISECATNVMSAINGPLQARTNVLQLDSTRANLFPEDYETDLENGWSNLNVFADGNDFSAETIEKNRNLYYQKQSAKQISAEVTQTMSLLTSALNIHLNTGQNLTINSPSVFISLETQSLESISNKVIQQVGNGQIRIPSNFNTNSTKNETISLRSVMQPLASADQSQSNTNLSRSVSFSVLNQDGNELSITTNSTNPFELIIPRDPSSLIPPMNLQDVLAIPQPQFFNLHYINITSTLTISVHFEIRPLNENISYLFIYKFDGTPQLNTNDGWTLFCSSDLTNETIYKYFLDNEQTSGHQSVVFGLRELNISENCSMTDSPITNETSNFTSNYELRVYTSGCYYLDQNNQWQSDGLKVGPLTNHYQTQCFSTHITTFASSFMILPVPNHWNHTFVDADFLDEKSVTCSTVRQKYFENGNYSYEPGWK